MSEFKRDITKRAKSNLDFYIELFNNHIINVSFIGLTGVLRDKGSNFISWEKLVTKNQAIKFQYNKVLKLKNKKNYKPSITTRIFNRNNKTRIPFIIFTTNQLQLISKKPFKVSFYEFKFNGSTIKENLSNKDFVVLNFANYSNEIQSIINYLHKKGKEPEDFWNNKMWKELNDALKMIFSSSVDVLNDKEEKEAFINNNFLDAKSSNILLYLPFNPMHKYINGCIYVYLHCEKKLNLGELKLLIPNLYEPLKDIYFAELINLNSKNSLKTAIISILIDSYAHNISAHSLAALKWWIELRHKMLDKRFSVPITPIKKDNGEVFPEINPIDLKSINIDKTKETTKKYYEALGLTDSSYDEGFYSLYDFLQFAEPGTTHKLLSFTEQVKLMDKDSSDIIIKKNSFNPRFPVPIDYALFPFFRFLRDKGAFWSGVTRDAAFGGESKTWYKILLEDFANNPLYLGTIAKTEGITKININLAVKENDKWFSGRFVTIDLGVMDYESKLVSDKALKFQYSLDDNSLILDFIENCDTDEIYKKLINENKLNVSNDGFDSNSVKDLLKKVIAEIDKKRNDTDKANKIDNVNDLLIKGEHVLKEFNNIGIDKLVETLNWLISYIYFDFYSDDSTLCDIESNMAAEAKINCADSLSKKIEDLKYSKYAYIRLGKCFSHFRNILSENEFEVFLPGGVVGEHALFTIFENTIRNIKHYKNSINNIKWNGLDFWISIEKKELTSPNNSYSRDKNKPKEHFLVSTWLGHKTDLISKNVKGEDEILWQKVTHKTLDKILDENGAPRMGGNSQDKACAALLFNNQFGSVEDRGETETEREQRDKNYYPWLHYTSSDNPKMFDTQYDHLKFDEVKEYYIQNENERQNIIQSYKNKINSNYLGYIKKSFFLWSGADYITVNSKSDFYSENVSRFKFVIISDKMKGKVKEEIIYEARKNGVIRLLYDKEEECQMQSLILDLEKSEIQGHLKNKNETLIKLYLIWLKKWLKKEKYGIRFKKGRNPVSVIKLTDETVKYDPVKDKADVDERTDYLNIALSHGGGDEPTSCNVRSHGAFWNKYFEKAEKKDPEDLKNDNPQPYDEEKEYLLSDLLEVLGTKLVIFDDRINDRMPRDNTKRKEVFEKQLQIYISCEIADKQKQKGYFNSLLETILGNTEEHNSPLILVVHLTYIETLGYKESDINTFIENEIKDFISKENFIFVITTGRGRISWQDKLKEDYKIRTIFKPVESLLSAIESGISYNDNFDVKHNLIKAIIGA